MISGGVVTDVGVKKRLLVVLGMHRSGTSAVTRGLQTFGVSLGDRLMPPAAGNNDKGFFEDLDIVELNIDILKEIGGEWYDVAPIDAHSFDLLRARGYVLRAVELLRKKLATTNAFAFKDPRVAKLLPFWNEVIAHLHLDVGYVLALRNPLSVVKSLAKRDALMPEHGYLLWVTHILEGLRGSLGKSGVIVDYDQLMLFPDEGIMRIADFFGMNVDPVELENYKNEFLDGKLRHTIYAPDDLLLDRACPPIVLEIFCELSNIARGNTGIDADVLCNKITAWTHEYDRLKSAMFLVDKQQKQITHLSQALHDRDSQLATHNQALAERAEQLAGLQQAVVQRDEKIGELSEAAAQREAELARERQLAAERESQITHLSQALHERKTQIAVLNQALAKRDDDLKALKNAMTAYEAQLEKFARLEQEHAQQSHALHAQLQQVKEERHLLENLMEEKEMQICDLTKELRETKEDIQIFKTKQHFIYSSIQDTKSIILAAKN